MKSYYNFILFILLVNCFIYLTILINYKIKKRNKLIKKNELNKNNKIKKINNNLDDKISSSNNKLKKTIKKYNKIKDIIKNIEKKTQMKLDSSNFEDGMDTSQANKGLDKRLNIHTNLDNPEERDSLGF